MKLALLIIVVVTLLAGGLLFVSPKQPADLQLGMPWQVDVRDPQHSEVFGIRLNQTSLQRASDTLGQVEGIALYRQADGEFDLEAYFGKISIGPLSARLIANLEGAADELQQLSMETRKRTATESGNMKWILSEQQQAAQLQRRIVSLTFIPDYGGMDESYLLQRFGQPEQRQPVDASSELWFYPNKGVRILFDREGREVFEYVVPAHFSTLLGVPS